MAIKQIEFILGICLFMLVAGCTAGISKASRSQVTYKGNFADLQKNPDAFGNEIVMFGGKILKTQVSPNSSELMVLQLPLDSNGRPVNQIQSEGRFLIHSDQFLDPANYKKGAFLTVVGVSKGKKIRPIGDYDYVYPLLEEIEIKLWPNEIRTSPRFHFGFGIGTTF